MPAGTAGRDHEQFCQWILAGNINKLDIDSFEVFESGDYQLPELLERQCVRSVLLAQ